MTASPGVAELIKSRNDTSCGVLPAQRASAVSARSYGRSASSSFVERLCDLASRIPSQTSLGLADSLQLRTHSASSRMPL